MTSYYFAAKFSRHPELREYRRQLTTAIPDSVVTSRWIDCSDGAAEDLLAVDFLNTNPAVGWEFAEMDLKDVGSADVLVSFTGPVGKGGRHVEHGYAMALAKRIVIVGPRDNVFHCAPDSEVYPTWQDFLAAECQ